MSKDNSAPAFPNVPDGAGDKWQDWDKGMTLRDYFAAKALNALIPLCITDNNAQDYPTYCAAQAYAMADAMLAERAKP